MRMRFAVTSHTWTILLNMRMAALTCQEHFAVSRKSHALLWSDHHVTNNLNVCNSCVGQ